MDYNEDNFSSMFPTDPHKLRLERGRRRSCFPRRFVPAAAYDLPFGKGRALTRIAAFQAPPAMALGNRPKFPDIQGPCLANLDVSLNHTNFGRITSARLPRTIQIGGKFWF
jgi:hypothetical protein